MEPRVVETTPVGRNEKALCPWHGESTPSLTIYKGTRWQCHGCGLSGDARSVGDARVELTPTRISRNPSPEDVANGDDMPADARIVRR